MPGVHDNELRARYAWRRDSSFGQQGLGPRALDPLANQASPRRQRHRKRYPRASHIGITWYRISESPFRATQVEFINAPTESYLLCRIGVQKNTAPHKFWRFIEKALLEDLS